MFSKELHQAGHTRRFLITQRGREGWEVRQEQDDRVLKRVCYQDWHRVERAMSLFNLQVGELERRGWATESLIPDRSS